MILIHKETAAIYELRIIAVNDEVFPLREPVSHKGHLLHNAFTIGLITLHGDGQPSGVTTYNEIGDVFEILGWL